MSGDVGPGAACAGFREGVGLVGAGLLEGATGSALDGFDEAEGGAASGAGVNVARNRTAVSDGPCTMVYGSKPSARRMKRRGAAPTAALSMVSESGVRPRSASPSKTLAPLGVDSMANVNPATVVAVGAAGDAT